jgi:hypothetical protein
MRSEIGTRWCFGWSIVAAAAVLTLLSTGMRLGMGGVASLQLPRRAGLPMTPCPAPAR